MENSLFGDINTKFTHDRLVFVEKFMRVFNQAVPNTQFEISLETMKLRLELISEEILELAEAMDKYHSAIVNSDKDNFDMTEIKADILDALVDIEYILLGTVAAFGLSPVFMKAFLEAHNSNMSKLGNNGRPIYRGDGKVLKGPNYRAPDFKQFVEKR
jgi:predicted HAD superfamily Cof-like phosphohydrolase